MNNVNNQRDKAYHHGNLRQELVQIGVRLAGEKGPEAVVVREVARQAGVSPSAAYRHFSGQEGLLDAVRDVVLRALQEHMAEAVGAVPSGAPAVERIVAAGRGYFGFALQEPMLFHCLTRSFPLREDWTEGENPFAVLVGLVEEAAAEAGSGRQATADHFAAAVSLWSAVHGMSVLSASGGLRELPEDGKGSLLEYTLQAAVRGIGL